MQELPKAGSGTRTPSDIEKNVDALEGSSAVDPGVYSGVHDVAHPEDGTWAKFNAFNRKLERKMGIESVSVSDEHSMVRNIRLIACSGELSVFQSLLDLTSDW